jgi:hypothetical protein
MVIINLLTQLLMRHKNQICRTPTPITKTVKKNPHLGPKQLPANFDIKE